MNIIGPDALIFGVDDVLSCNRFLLDYGLKPVYVSANGGRFEALDGTYIEIQRRDDPTLPAPLPTAATIRKTIYGVADAESLEAIFNELSADREVFRLPDGSLETVDDSGFVLGFQLTVRRPLDRIGERINSPGCVPQRPVNVIGADDSIEIALSTFSHVVYFVPNVAEAEAFYVNRLGFRVTDRFTQLGPFLRPTGTSDHHTLFLISTPPEMQGVEHFTFHVAGPTELLLAGRKFCEKGYQSFWGPGRHVFGSNWFWYFNSPMGVHVEYDADMDIHDDNWIPRESDADADTSQIFNFRLATKWVPGGDPH